MKKCLACKTDIEYGILCKAQACRDKWNEYRKPRPEHTILERERAREKYAQADRVPTEDEPKVRSKPA